MIDKNTNAIINDYCNTPYSILDLATKYHKSKQSISNILHNSNNELVLAKLSDRSQRKSKSHCTINGCQKNEYSKGLCKQHHWEVNLFGKVLSDNDKKCCTCGRIDSSNRRFKGRYYCEKHYGQIYKYGTTLDYTKFDPNPFLIDGENIYVSIVGKNKTTFIIDKSSIWVLKYKFHIRSDGYVGTRINGQTCLLHRLLMNATNKDQFVDHINRNKLDNRLSNLRFVTPSESAINRGKGKDNTSGCIGVTYDKSRGQWKVSLNKNRICYNIGRYNSLEEAIRQRLLAEKKYYGDMAPQKNMFQQYHI